LALIATAAASFLLNIVISSVPTAVVSAILTPYDRAAAPDDDDVYLNRLQVSFHKYSLHVKYQPRRHKYRTNKQLSKTNQLEK
jgi:hypothetical protein